MPTFEKVTSINDSFDEAEKLVPIQPTPDKTFNEEDSGSDIDSSDNLAQKK